MFDERFIAVLAAKIAERVERQIEQDKGKAKSPKRLLSVVEAAVYTGRTPQAIQHLIWKRQIPVVRIGRRVHLDRIDLDRWIEGNKT